MRCRSRGGQRVRAGLCSVLPPLGSLTPLLLNAPAHCFFTASCLLSVTRRTDVWAEWGSRLAYVGCAVLTHSMQHSSLLRLHASACHDQMSYVCVASFCMRALQRSARTHLRRLGDTLVFVDQATIPGTAQDPSASSASQDQDSRARDTDSSTNARGSAPHSLAEISRCRFICVRSTSPAFLRWRSIYPDADPSWEDAGWCGNPPDYVGRTS
ncbi:hypothetical protein FKP32DRAFT_87792 [Trametes sanguinea]|nr:hypothetical protein FKP32DRAFT_87792 [Trametes sanguinea]